MFRQEIYTILASLAICTVLSCNTRDSKQNAGKEGVQNAEIFPVNAFFADQLQFVDSLKLPAIKYTTIKNESDTSSISPLEFSELAKEFMTPDITTPSLSRYYKETGFADQSSPSVTFTYSTLKKDLEVQRMDVVINPDPVLDDKVRSIYIEKIGSAGDTSIVKKMYWKANRFFQIITLRQLGNTPPVASQVKIAWDSFDE